jgi:hypothetical protein
LGWGAALAVAGCGGTGPELAGVTGVVTLDGKPLPGVVVEFQPPGGAPSEAVTDQEGVYSLKYAYNRRGAMIGIHKVRISSYRTDETDHGEAIVVKEVVPTRYNRHSELTAEVKPGRNAIDFALNSNVSSNGGARR